MQKISRQQRWAEKQKADGNCTRCGNKLGRFKWLCDYCQSKASSYMRRWREAQKAAQKVKARMLK